MLLRFNRLRRLLLVLELLLLLMLLLMLLLLLLLQHASNLGLLMQVSLLYAVSECCAMLRKLLLGDTLMRCNGQWYHVWGLGYSHRRLRV